MANESAAIVEILKTVGVYDWLSKKIQNESELIELFENDFCGLVGMCQEK